MPILVTGATGNVGRHLVGQLAAAGHRVRALTRDPDAAAFPDGVEAVGGDLADPSSLKAAFDGATAVHLLSSHQPANEPPGAGEVALAHAGELLAMAEQAGVRRVSVLWTGAQGPVEEAAKQSGLEWTIVQPGNFMANARLWAEDVRTEGVVREPFAQVAHYVVHEADIAAVAAAALTGEGHAGKEYTLVGPEGLTVPQQVAILSQAVGREIRYEELTEEQAEDRMRELGMGDEDIDFIVGWNADQANEDRLAAEAADIAAITGRPPRAFAQWAAEHADAFR
ncbi:NAD(P)H-binding protein [Glycomyces sp. TRM65418]|uniref:SDR family oxidoreductase n=1 Tax=Glycomyces sp. TRM65418 TaxID=2867006 RepID=UPI001CE4EB44|nr:NAD(P)H-binding protein [Glycomyces sp. TRM65418]MCC3762032.1 NAD(P)H-binding protein [Glycomyces sp. TRM65418]QZD56104.1 NAD(P)H-binding protein [Glycomyces sp. TRM65418]